MGGTSSVEALSRWFPGYFVGCMQWLSDVEGNSKRQACGGQLCLGSYVLVAILQLCGIHFSGAAATSTRFLWATTMRFRLYICTI